MKYCLILLSFLSQCAFAQQPTVVPEDTLVGSIDEVSYRRFQGEGFEISYPSTWVVRPHPRATVPFVCFPINTSGAFNENLNLVLQPVVKDHKKLRSFVEYMKAFMKKEYSDYEVVSDIKGKTKSYKYRDVVYTLSRESGPAIVHFQSWTRFFIVGKQSYQITFTAEASKYDARVPEVTQMMNSFAITR